jgi:formylglycine-generating enzyme required for sulfatase activity
MTAGGLIGQAKNAQISGSRALGNVSVSGNFVGGAIGKAEGTEVQNCFALGSASNQSSYAGGFAGLLSDCNVSSSFARGEAKSTGSNYYAGGFTGAVIRGTITKCHALGNVTGFAYVGGLAGIIDAATVSSCYAEGPVSGTISTGGLVGLLKAGNLQYSYASGTVTGVNAAGGLIGNYQASVASCYAQGAVNASAVGGGLVGMNASPGTITCCFSTGAVTSTSMAGGLIGYNTNAAGVTYSYWNRETSGQAASAGGESRTTTQMQQASANGTVSGQAVYQNWGTGYWHFAPTTMYPRLKSAFNMVMVEVPAGTYQRDSSAANVSTVSGFMIGVCEVTQQQFVGVTGRVNPSYSPDSLNPVQGMNWYAALEFCNRLSISEGLTPAYSISGSTNPDNWGTIPSSNATAWNNATCNWNANGYRLPTEDEWQWASMGAVNSWNRPFAGSTGTNAIADYAWYSANSGGVINRSMLKQPNELTLYDMSGNMWEMVWDKAGTSLTGARTNYRGPTSGTYRVVRGGDFTRDATWQTITSNLRILYPYNAYTNVGFRVVRKIS